jgi:NAD(P)-dependent dehydrogenase (short-subunit alcohol dehydrogenase family)
MTVGGVVDTLLDRSVVLGFSRIGLSVRSRLSGWPSDPPGDALLGRDVAVTGATSGLGLATALGVARLGARVHLVVRDPAKAKAVVAKIAATSPSTVVEVHRCDVGDLDDVRRFVGEFRSTGHRLDVLVHNAGVMPPERTESAQGHELAMAVHVLGPVLMTELLRPTLRESDGPRVLLVTSGGMYTQKLRADDPEYLTGDYSPTTAYARSKRAQVELLPVLQQRWGSEGAHVWATHPGWAGTPGVAESLPRFNKLTGPVLRDADGGADTTVWLAATDPAPAAGGLWHDRRQRPTHFLPTTRTPTADTERMWDWVAEETGIGA